MAGQAAVGRRGRARGTERTAPAAARLAGPACAGPRPRVSTSRSRGTTTRNGRRRRGAAGRGRRAGPESPASVDAAVRGQTRAPRAAACAATDRASRGQERRYGEPARHGGGCDRRPPSRGAAGHELDAHDPAAAPPRPPRAPRSRPSAQSAPFTSTSGREGRDDRRAACPRRRPPRGRRTRGRARVSARSASGMSGRPSPLSARTERSLLMARPRAGRLRPARPRAGATWPGWSRSKQPFVNTTTARRRPASARASRRELGEGLWAAVTRASGRV